MSRYQAALTALRQNPKTWLVTGVAGFIGSNLLECLLSLGQAVVGLDNFSTGHPKNIDEALERGGVGARFRLIYGDICDAATCREACSGVDVVLHQAALGSVPLSMSDPASSHAANVSGFLNMLVAARDSNVTRFVYASSCAVYGDDPGLPKREEHIGQALSPYAATKLMDEIYAGVFQRAFGLETVGLRYFNVFGKRQDPQGPYAAVIPRWVSAFVANKPCVILGDGLTSRDFVHVDNVVEANLLAATENESVTGQVYNVGSGVRTTLNELHAIIAEAIGEADSARNAPIYEPFRPGDIRHSFADLEKARRQLGYVPHRSVAEGMKDAIEWYVTTDASAESKRQSEAPVLRSPNLNIVDSFQSR
ncbi:MAG TPA: SDR family oxidoreductase [Bradyrhizobium sp.]|jgi:UDP-N-acetylglucosamine 4-epimerase|nr:SDR family oxidoreductase [Bradyrhizobium sp.]